MIKIKNSNKWVLLYHIRKNNSYKLFLKNSRKEVPTVVQWVKNLTAVTWVAVEVQVQSLLW